MPYTEEEVVDDTDKLKYLTTDQALADYAALIDSLQKDAWGYSDEVDMDNYDVGGEAIIGFGGSYGGMLAAWYITNSLYISPSISTVHSLCNMLSHCEHPLKSHRKCKDIPLRIPSESSFNPYSESSVHLLSEFILKMLEIP